MFIYYVLKFACSLIRTIINVKLIHNKCHIIIIKYYQFTFFAINNLYNLNFWVGKKEVFIN